MTPAVIRPVDLLRRIQCEFLEMPGLCLTEPQARRLWNLDEASCAALLSELLEGGFLCRNRQGSFMRIEHASPLVQLPGDRPVA